MYAVHCTVTHMGNFMSVRRTPTVIEWRPLYVISVIYSRQIIGIVPKKTNYFNLMCIYIYIRVIVLNRFKIRFQYIK